MGNVIVNGIFGEYDFFTGDERVYGARAKEASSILKIKREDFMKII